MFAPISKKTASGYKSMAFITPTTRGPSNTPKDKMPPDTNLSTVTFFMQIMVEVPTEIHKIPKIVVKKLTSSLYLYIGLQSPYTCQEPLMETLSPS